MVRLLAGLLRRLAPACAGLRRLAPACAGLRRSIETILSFVIIQQYGRKSNGVWGICGIFRLIRGRTAECLRHRASPPGDVYPVWGNSPRSIRMNRSRRARLNRAEPAIRYQGPFSRPCRFGLRRSLLPAAISCF